jgi:hypothetical protein
MSALTGTTPKTTYLDLLRVLNSNQGLDATSRRVESGSGADSALLLSTTKLSVAAVGDDTKRIDFSHDGTDGVIESQSGKLFLDTLAGADVTIRGAANALRAEFKTAGPTFYNQSTIIAQDNAINSGLCIKPNNQSVQTNYGFGGISGTFSIFDVNFANGNGVYYWRGRSQTGNVFADRTDAAFSVDSIGTTVAIQCLHSRAGQTADYFACVDENNKKLFRVLTNGALQLQDTATNSVRLAISPQGSNYLLVTDNAGIRGSGLVEAGTLLAYDINGSGVSITPTGISLSTGASFGNSGINVDPFVILNGILDFGSLIHGDVGSDILSFACSNITFNGSTLNMESTDIKIWNGSTITLFQTHLGTQSLGFFGSSSTKLTVTGSRSGNAALASLLTQLATYGLITNSSTA